MAAAGGVFEVERQGRTLVVTPVTDLRELDYQGIEAGAAAVLDLLGSGSIPNVILDLGRTDSFGTTALGFFMTLWKRVREQDGRMALCNLSAHEREILSVTKLDGLWPLCPTREEALRAVEGGAPDAG